MKELWMLTGFLYYYGLFWKRVADKAWLLCNQFFDHLLESLVIRRQNFLGLLQLCKEWKEEMIMYFGIGCLFI